MKNEKDTRLYDALDFIDSDLIGETAELLMQPIKPQAQNQRIKRLALIAACICLIAISIPVIMTLTNFDTTIVITESSAPLPFAGPNEGTVGTNINVYDGSRGLVYKASDDGSYAVLVDIGYCTDTDITVATAYNGLPVKAVRFGALSRCDAVESVIFPDNVEEIGVRVLSECPNLKRIYLGAGVRLIDLHAFSECDIEDIVISPENPHLVFRDGCVIDTAAKTLILGIRGAVIPGDGSVERIGYSAFSGRRGISSLIIPEGIKEICSFAFEGCDVERIALPKSIEKLGTSTLRDCKYLKSFDLGGYSDLPDYSLDGCDALREVTGLENVTRIGKYALSVGADLHSIRLTSSLKSIDEYACLKASSLNRIYFDGTVEQWNAISKGKGWNLRTPDTRIICNDGEV
jgi:hypothetical protein